MKVLLVQGPILSIVPVTRAAWEARPKAKACSNTACKQQAKCGWLEYVHWQVKVLTEQLCASALPGLLGVSVVSEVQRERGSLRRLTCTISDCWADRRAARAAVATWIDAGVLMISWPNTAWTYALDKAS